MFSVASAIAAALRCIAGVPETRSDMLELMTDSVKDDHERSVGDEIASATVSVLADELIEFAVSVLVVSFLGLDSSGVDFSHRSTYDHLI